MNSGNVHSLDAPTAYAKIASARQEPTTHIEINWDSGNLSMSTPRKALMDRKRLLPEATARPVGVISPKALQRGTPSPGSTVSRC